MFTTDDNSGSSSDPFAVDSFDDLTKGSTDDLANDSGLESGQSQIFPDDNHDSSQQVADTSMNDEGVIHSEFNINQ